MTKPAIAFALVFAVACGGSEKTPEAPKDDSPGEEPPAAAEVLTIAPFVLTVTGTKQDGSTQVRVFRGSADGVLSVEDGGETKEVARVSADGTITPLTEGRTDVARLSAEGVLTVNGKPLPGRVDENGTVYRGDEAILKIEGGKVIGLIEGVMSSKVTANGKVVSESKSEMTVEGGDEVRRLVGLVLLLQMTGGEAETSVVEQKGEPAPVPAPAPK